MTTDLTPRRRMRIPRARQPQHSDPRAQQELMYELSHLPPARRGPALRPGTRIVRPSLTRRQQQPMMSRLLEGDFQPRLLFVLTGVTIFVVVVVMLGGSFFV